jgi:hypothetical protein
MFIASRVFTRPNTNVLYYRYPAAYVKYHAEKYQNTHLVNSTLTLSNDGLSRTSVNMYVSEEAFNTVANDPVVRDAWAARDAYNTANGITVTDLKTVTI